MAQSRASRLRTYLIVGVAGFFALMLASVAVGYLWGVNPWALPLVGVMIFTIPALGSGLLLLVGYAIFQEKDP
ncbi:hypothetical protein [Phenylobacterium aquaticum]|uniref:hypothetical protein n=1 Tax=Phenylobacterium aquaticum TaxID=1763816 RepID=UPI0026ED40A1|nr:hypothetical protein [Phenylobacterium aquaticum]